MKNLGSRQAMEQDIGVLAANDRYHMGLDGADEGPHCTFAILRQRPEIPEHLDYCCGRRRKASDRTIDRLPDLAISEVSPLAVEVPRQITPTLRIAQRRFELRRSEILTSRLDSRMEPRLIISDQGMACDFCHQVVEFENVRRSDPHPKLFTLFFASSREPHPSRDDVRTGLIAPSEQYLRLRQLLSSHGRIEFRQRINRFDGRDRLRHRLIRHRQSRSIWLCFRGRRG